MEQQQSPQQPWQQQPPQQDWQQSQQNYQPRPTNTMAILGLVFAFVFPILGLVFSIIGLSNAKQMKGEGHGLALAGLIVSIVWMALALIIIIVAVVVAANNVPTWHVQW